jgi:GNAT superfamily N-acetyltransferase
MEGLNKKILVTYMQAFQEPNLVPDLPFAVAILERELSASQYIKLYRSVGDQVNWDSRLKMSRAKLSELLARTCNRIFMLQEKGLALGMCEFSIGDSDIELTHFGLVPRAQGRGLGFVFLAQCLNIIWAQKPNRIWLHTDEWDSQNAQKLYARAGFAVFKQVMEEPDLL